MPQASVSSIYVLRFTIHAVLTASPAPPRTAGPSDQHPLSTQHFLPQTLIKCPQTRNPPRNRTEATMSDYKTDFLQFAHERDVLRFGEFTLKSGRVSPYFFNAGLFNTGAALHRLGQFYARAVVEAGIDFDMIFGPAYKGIPLATVTASALAAEHGRDVPYCFNRKEAKDHGEGGNLVGAPLEGRVLIVDDVITAGTAIREAVDIIRAAGAAPVGVVIALDRQETGPDGQSAIQQVEAEYGMSVASIVTLNDLMNWLPDTGEWAAHRQSVQAYRERYGTA